MENKLFEKLDDLNIKDVSLLLEKDINLSVGHYARKRIEKSVNKKTGYYNRENMFIQNINNILGGIFMKRKMALVLSACIFASLGGGVLAYAKTNPVAYVSMDINPSIELGVNTFDEVVSAEAYNEDGKKVLEGTDLINVDVDDAVSTLITNAISEGYISEDGTSAIEITTATDKEGVAAELDETLNEVVDETLSNNNVEAEVETENVALARRDEARELGITPGKLNLIQKLQALDPTITIEDYKDSSVKEIQKKTKELRKNNKNSEVTTEDSTNTTDTNIDTDTNTNINSTANESIDNSSNNSDNSKKEENSSSNNKKEENNGLSNKEKDATTTTEKQNNGSNSNSQNKNNSSQQNNGNNKEKNKNN